MKARGRCRACERIVNLRADGSTGFHKVNGKACSGAGLRLRKDKGPTTEAELPW